MRLFAPKLIATVFLVIDKAMVDVLDSFLVTDLASEVRSIWTNGYIKALHCSDCSYRY